MEFDTLIPRMLQHGVSQIQIAAILGVELDYVYQFPNPDKPNLSDVEELSQAMLALSWQAYEEGTRVLHQGSGPMKMRLISLIVSRNIGLARTGSSKELQSMNSQLQEILAGMTEGISIDENADQLAEYDAES